MHLKDYYRILELEPSATLQEIKKTFRRLAQQYHPDKNQQDANATAQFTEIKEAYEVLTNPAKKEYYLQQRWYSQSMGRRKMQPVITPVNILKQVLELDKYVSTLDVHRMDKEGLYQYLCNILSDEAIEKLNSLNDTVINKEIISRIMNFISPFSLQSVDDLQKRLLKIRTDESTVEKLKVTLQSFHKRNFRNKYRVWIILLIAGALSLLIFFLG